MIKIRRADKATTEELADFHRLVLKGGRVSADGLMDRIKKCELLAFYYEKGELAAISAVKKPTAGYIENLSRKIGYQIDTTRPVFELGYSVTTLKHRQKGISGNLKNRLLERARKAKGLLFTTINLPSSKRYMERAGFEKKGNPFTGAIEGIEYWELKLRGA